MAVAEYGILTGGSGSGGVRDPDRGRRQRRSPGSCEVGGGAERAGARRMVLGREPVRASCGRKAFLNFVEPVGDDSKKKTEGVCDYITVFAPTDVCLSIILG